MVAQWSYLLVERRTLHCVRVLCRTNSVRKKPQSQGAYERLLAIIKVVLPENSPKGKPDKQQRRWDGG